MVIIMSDQFPTRNRIEVSIDTSNLNNRLVITVWNGNENLSITLSKLHAKRLAQDILNAYAALPQDPIPVYSYEGSLP